MIKYIVEILKIQSSVILPGFGALQVANAKTGKIAFNGLLKFNDGTLAKYIAEKEGIDQQAAQNQIAKFIREIEAEISKGNSFDMFQFGKFQKNKKGEVEFIQEGTPVAITSDTKKSAPAVKETKAAVEKKPEPKTEKKTEKPAEKKAEAKPAKKTEEKPAEVKPAEKPKADTKKEVPAEVKPKTEEPKPAAPKAEENSLDSIKKMLAEKAAAAKKDEPKVEKPAEKKVELKPDPSPEVNKSGKPVAESDPPKKHGIPEEKVAEAGDSKQHKNTFTPKDSGADEPSKDSGIAGSGAGIDKPEVKIPEVSKNIPLAEASKNPAAQEKNKFVPPAEEKKIEATPDVAKANPKVMAASVKEEKIVEETSNGTKEKFKKDKPQKVKNEVPKEKKKKSKWMTWLILLIIVGGGATAGWMYQKEIKSFFYTGVGDDHDSTTTATNDTHEDSVSTENVIHDAEETGADTSTTEELIVEEPVTEEPVIEEPEKPVQHVDNSSSGGSYHLIGNSFSSKENAENYADKMSGKGYPAKVLGKFDNLYLVSIKQYSSREDAKAGISSVSSDAASAWVFKY